MKALILAGGKGTRLLPYTTVLPKPLLPVGDRPILDIVVKQLMQAKMTEIIISVGHLGELIKAYFANFNGNGTKISYFHEKSPLGTAGPIAACNGLDDTFLVMNGDILTDLDYTQLIEYHKQNRGILTIAMYEKKVPIELGVMEVDDGSRLISYVEKPTTSHRVSMGIYVFEARVKKYIAHNRYLDFPDLVLRLLDRGERIMGYSFDGRWLDIGKKSNFQEAQGLYEQMQDRSQGEQS